MDRDRSIDENAFLVIYQAHRTPLFRFVWRMTGSVEIAEDVTQECFLLLVRGNTAFDDRQGSLRNYLFGAARHLVFRRLRLSSHETEESSEEPATTADTDTLTSLLAGERAAMVQRAVASLPPLQREVILLFEYEDLTLEAVAAVTGVPVGAVKARLQRARHSLRKHLAPLLVTSRHTTNRERSCL